MRKSFTRLFSLAALFCVLGLQMVYGGVIDRVPADGKTNVNPSTDLSLTFDYPLATGDNYNGAVIQLKNSGGITVDAITLPSSRFVIDGSKIAIDIQATLTDLTDYYVVIPDKVVKEKKPDGTSVNFLGYSNSGDWNFKTGDFTAPKLATASTFIPVDGATNVGGPFSSSNALSIKTTNFEVNFTEPIIGVSGKYIKIYTAAGNIHEMIDASDASRITISSTGSSNGKVAFSTVNLREKSDYYVLIDAGAFIDASEAKNEFAGISDKTKWNITTRDYTVAAFAIDYPVFGTVANHSVALKVKLNEPAFVYFLAKTKAQTEASGFTAPTISDIGTGNAIDATTAGTEYTFNYAGLTEGESYVFYYYTVNKSSYGSTPDPLTSAVMKTGDVTTLDVQPPTVATYIPSLGQGNGGTNGVDLYLDNSGADGHGTFSIQFTENVKGTSGNIILKKSSDNSTIESVDVTSSAVSFEAASGSATGSTDLVVVKFATKLASATKYYVQIASGVITDKTGNKYTGINTSTAWTFTTKDVIPSTVAFSAPASTKGVLSKEENVVITSSKDIYSSEGDIVTSGDDASASVRIERNNADVSSMFSITYTGTNKITINPIAAGSPATSSEAWLENSIYVVKLLKGTIYDASGNVIAKEVVKSYTTDSYDVPSTTSWTTSPIAASANISFKFTEPVELLGGGAITSDNVGSLITLTETGGAPVSFVATYSATDLKVTIDPVSDLSSTKTYTVNLSAGYQDFNLIGGPNQGTAATKAYSITDKVAPTITFDFTKTNVPTSGAGLVVKFSKSVSTVSASQVTLREGDANGKVIPVTLATSADPVYTFNPSVTLKEGTTYYLSFADQVVVDATPSANKNVGANTTFITKTTPTLVSTVPADNAEGVAKDISTVTLNYSENVKMSPSYTLSGGTYFTTYPVVVVDGTGAIVAHATSSAADLVFVGSTVTINLSAFSPALVSGASYDVLVDAGLILSANNNPAAPIALNDLDFTMKDFAAPVLATTGALLTDATTASSKMASPLLLTFNEKVTKGTGTIIIQRVDIASQPQQVIDVNSSNVSISEDGLTVSVSHVPFIPSLSATTVIYEVVVSNGAIVDLAGNKFAGLIHNATPATSVITGPGQNYTTDALASGKQWYISTPLDAAPAWKPTASTPGVDADKVSTSTSIVIAFDKAISLADGTKKVTVSTSTGVAQEYRLNESNVSVSGSNITVTLQTLAANTEYFISLEAGAVKDAYNATNAAIVGNPNWNFNTGDANGPVPTVTVNGTKNSTTGAWEKVKRNSDIVITFDEAIRLVSNAAISSADIPEGIVHITGTGVPSYTADLSTDKKTITINASSFTSALLSMGSYTIVVSGIEDSNNNPIATNSFTFQVDDYDAPAGVYNLDVDQTGNGTAGAAPAGFKVIENYKGTELKVEFDYNENATVYYQLLARTATTPSVATLMANGTAVSVSKDADPATSTVIPTTEGTQYKLVVVAVDLVNATAQSLVETQLIQTADVTAPTVVEYVNNGKLDVTPTTFDVSLKFTTKVQKGSGNLYVFDTNNVLIGAAYPASGVTLSADGKQITQTVTGLVSNKSYYIVIDKGFVKDESSTLPSPNRYTDPTTRSENVFAGFSNNATYKFSTKDTNPPTVSSVTPHNTAAGTNVTAISTAIDADVNSNIVITFSEDIKLGSAAGSGDIEIWKAGTSNLQELILATSSQVTISGKVMTINPSIDFGDGLSDITVKVKDDVIADIAGNDADGFAWKFNVKDLAAPKVGFLVNATGGDKVDKAPVALNTQIYVEFSEAVKLLDESAFITDDLDTLITFVDGAKKAVAFTTSTSGTNNFKIIPTGGLKSDMDYVISFGQVFMDAAKNKVPAQSVSFTTKLTNSPTVMFDPKNASVNVAADKTITVTFGRGIVQQDYTTSGGVATGFFSSLENSELKDYFNLSDDNGDIAFDATISTNKRVVTIKPNVNLDSQATVYLEFDFGGTSPALRADLLKSASISDPILPALVDSLNNQVMANPDDVEETHDGGISGYIQFDVVDTEAPVLAGTKYVPNEAGYLNAGDKLSIQFNEKVKAGTGDVKIYRKDGTLVQTIAASTLTTKSDDETIIVINPSVDARENNMEYYVLIPAGAIVDKSPLANAFAGTVDYTSWTYSTSDNQTPVVVSLSPASGSKDVYVYDNLVITFDKKVKLGSGNLAIYKKSGDAFDLLRVSTSEYRIKLDPSGLFVTIDFTNTLAPETEFYVEVEPGTFVNAKNSDAKFAGIMTNTGWTFSTEVTDAPKVIANGLVPADNATAIPVSKLVLDMTFDRQVMKGSGVVKLIETATGTLAETVNISDAVVSGTKATITFLNPLKSNTAYHVIVEAGTVTNTLPSKVAYAGITSPSIWNFTTVTDVTAPVLLTWTPNATTLTDNHPTLVMTFDEDVVLGVGSVKIVKKSDDATVITIPVTASMVSGKTVTVTYVATATDFLAQSTDYYVLVDAGVVKDAAGNNVVAVSDKTKWTFKTGADWATPVVDPKDNSLEFKVYPNPFVDYVTVSNASELSKVVVSNIAGQIVKEVVNPESTIQLNELRSGVYFISLYQDGAVLKTVKLLKR